MSDYKADTTSQPSDELEQLLQATKGSVFLYGDNMDAGQIRDFVKKLKTALLAREKRLTVAARIDELEGLRNKGLPIGFDPRMHTSYVVNRIKQLQAELDKQ